jgi:hypothetical protein
MLWQMAKAFARAATKKRQNPITRQVNKYIDDPNTTRLIGSDDYRRGMAMAKERADKQRGRREDGTPYKKPVTDSESVNLAEGWDEALEQAFRRAASMEVQPLRKLSGAHEAFIDGIIDDVVAKRVAPADVTSESGIIKNYPQLKDMELRRKMEGVQSRDDWRPRWIDGTPFTPRTRW